MADNPTNGDVKKTLESDLSGSRGPAVPSSAVACYGGWNSCRDLQSKNKCRNDFNGRVTSCGKHHMGFTVVSEHASVMLTYRYAERVHVDNAVAWIKDMAQGAAKVLTLTGMDILTDAELRKHMKADFDKRTEGFVYKAPIPDMIRALIGLSIGKDTG